jgi:5'(3')-deoxyribonucleotidase
MIKKDVKILVDMDGVLNNFQDHFISFVKNLGYGYDDTYKSSYTIETGILAKSKNKAKKIKLDILLDENFWITVKPLPNSFQGMKYLHDNFNLYIATTPFSKETEDWKIKWIDENFPFMDRNHIIFSDTKWELEGDIIIEDNPKNLTKCLDYGFATIKKDQPYNKEVEASYTLKNWLNIERIIENII